MIIRYEYVSTCCKSTYSETRNEDLGMVHPKCVQCGQGEYELVEEVNLGEPIPAQVIESDVTDFVEPPVITAPPIEQTN